MDSNEYLNDAYAILDLIHGCFEPSAPFEPTADISADRLLKISRKLGMSGLTAYALKRSGSDDPEVRTALAKAQRISVLYDAEYKKISSAMQKAGIYHLPLKGMAIKRLYPGVGLREMTDMDIWFDPDYAEALRDIMVGLGYAVKQFGKSKHDVYEKPPFCAEMHRCPVNSRLLPGCDEYYKSHWDRLICENSGGGYELSEKLEDTLVFLMVHTYKHYAMAGVGVRALLDIYVLTKYRGDLLDLEKVTRKCQILGIDGFAELVLRLSSNLFTRNNLTPADAQRLDEFLCSGTYGSIDRYYYNSIKKQAESSGKKAYILSRLRMPENQLESHPILMKHKFLRPFYLPVRLASTIALRPRMLSKELKMLRDFKTKEDIPEPGKNKK